MNSSHSHPIPAAPDRPIGGHKGTFGTVTVVGGSTGMIGAPALAATAALRIGAGLVKLAVPQSILPFCLTIEPSATGIGLDVQRDPLDAVSQLERACTDDTVLAIGPGMGVGRDHQSLLDALLRQPQRVVLDADGLNNLSQMRDAPNLPRCPLVMTPHPGEFDRLALAARIHVNSTDAQARPEAAAALAKAYNAVVVLKGQGTVISDGQRSHINTTGNPALATAGTGDVLTGTIAGLIAQGMDRFDAAVLGVYLHGLAADIWAKTHGTAGLTARDLADLLPNAHHVHCQT